MKPLAVHLEGKSMTLLPACCIHWPLTEKHLLLEWVDRLQATPDARGILMGDSLDCARSHYRNHIRSYRDDENSQEALDEYHRKEVRELAKILEPVKKKLFGAIRGNHFWEFCLQDSAQALTPSGWKHHSEISVGDLILAFNSDTNTTSWEPVLRKYVGDHDGPGVQTAFGWATKGHKWWGKTSGRCAQYQSVVPKYLLVPITAGPAAPPTATEPDWFVRLVAWVVTDGTLVKCATKPSMNRRVRIFQKPGEKSEGIRRDLELSGSKFAYHVRSDGIGVFEFGGPLAVRIRAVMDAKKRMHYAWLHTLSPGQVALLFDTFVLGDGASHDGVAQSDVSRLEPLMAAMVWSGIPCRMKKWASGLSVLYRKSRKWTGLNPRIGSFSGTVWCPTVKSGYWVARQDGRVFVTGNSDGTNSEQYICQLLQIPYLGAIAMIRVSFHKVKSNKVCTLVIYAHHSGGSAGARTTGGDVAGMVRSEAGFDADIYLTGHTHRRLAHKETVLALTTKGEPRVVDRSRVFARCGSFLKGFRDDHPNTMQPHRPSYAEVRALRPTDLGWVTIKVVWRERDKHRPDGSSRAGVDYPQYTLEY